MQNLVVVSHTLWTHVGGPKQFSGRWSSATLGRCRGWPPRNTLYFTTAPYMWHLTTFRHHRWNRLGVGMSLKKICRRLGPPPWDEAELTLETRYAPLVLPSQIRYCWDYRNYGNPRENWPVVRRLSR